MAAKEDAAVGSLVRLLIRAAGKQEAAQSAALRPWAAQVAFYEVVTTLFYEAPRRTLRLWFANLFKIGVVTGMLADALKLGS